MALLFELEERESDRETETEAERCRERKRRSHDQACFWHKHSKVTLIVLSYLEEELTTKTHHPSSLPLVENTKLMRK